MIIINKTIIFDDDYNLTTISIILLITITFIDLSSSQQQQQQDYTRKQNSRPGISSPKDRGRRHFDTGFQSLITFFTPLEGFFKYLLFFLFFFFFKTITRAIVVYLSGNKDLVVP